MRIYTSNVQIMAIKWQRNQTRRRKYVIEALDQSVTSVYSRERLEIGYQLQ